MTYRVEEPLGIITLNRPERRNAINSDMISRLHSALDEALDNEDIHAVFVSGEGSAFSAGVDLREAAGNYGRSHDDLVASGDTMARLFRRLRSYEKVTIAGVNGPALGSGCGLAVLCDFTLATGSARFGYPEVRYGFVPALVSVYLRGMVNEKRFRDLLLTGRVLSAEEAFEYGLVSKVVPQGGLLECGMEIGRIIGENAPAAIQMTKELLETLPGLDVDKALKAAVDYDARMRGSADCHKGIEAFLNKTAPDWRVEPPAEEDQASE